MKVGDYLNIIENRHYIKLDNLISHSCILNILLILLIKMEPRIHQTHEAITTKQQIFIRGVLKKKLKNIVNRIFRHANKGEDFLQEVATQIQKQHQESPEIVIAYYVFSQIGKQKDQMIPVQKAMEVFKTFLQALKISIHPPLQLQLHQILKSIAIPLSNQPISVANLWRDSQTTYDCYCQLYDTEIKWSKCYKCERRCHDDCFWVKGPCDAFYECPVCFLSKCLPHRPVDTVFFLGYLQYYPSYSAIYKIRFEMDMLRANLDNIQLRCICLDDEDRFKFTFPDNCKIILAGKQIKRYEPLAEGSQLKRRNDTYVQLDKKLLSYINTLCIEKNNTLYNRKHNANYFIAVVSTKPISSTQTIVQKYQQYRLSIHDSQRTLKQIINQDDNQSHMETISVSFQCQYFLSTITCPVRSKQCTNHYQPFDLKNFVTASFAAQGSLQAWHWPVCKSRAYDLEIDQYLLNLINNHEHLQFATFDRQGNLRSLQKQQHTLTIQVESSSSKQKDYQSQVYFQEQIPFGYQQKINVSQFQEHQSKATLKRTFNDRNLEDDDILEPQLKKLSTQGLSTMSQSIEQPPRAKENVINHMQLQAIKQKIFNYFKQKEVEYKSSQGKSLETMSNSQKIKSNPKEANIDQHLENKDEMESVQISQRSIEIIEDPLEKIILGRQRAGLEQVRRSLKGSGLTLFDKTMFNCFCSRLSSFDE